MSPVAIEGSVELAAREGVVVSRDGRSHERFEGSSGGPGACKQDDLPRATVMAGAWAFLDGECTAEISARLCGT